MLKQAVASVLGRAGYMVVHTGRRGGQRIPVLYTKAELQRLEADLETLGLNERESPVWGTPAAVRWYLANIRINFYHHVLAVAREAGVELDGKQVLDVGSCTGYLLRIIVESEPGAKLNGCDFYEEFVRLSRGLVPTANIFEASMADLASVPDRYDVIFCTETLEHILDTETPIPTLLGLLNSGGALVLTVPNGTYDSTPALDHADDGISYVGHVNFWSSESWRFYIERLAEGCTSSTGVFFRNDDGLFAVIFKP